MNKVVNKEQIDASESKKKKKNKKSNKNQVQGQKSVQAMSLLELKEKAQNRVEEIRKENREKS